MSATARPTGIMTASVFDIDAELRKGITKKANFAAPDGLINQPADDDIINLLSSKGLDVTRGGVGDYFLRKGAEVKYFPDLYALVKFTKKGA